MKTIAKLVGAAALVCSAASMAATIEVRPQAGAGVTLGAGCCTADVLPGTTFSLVVHGDSFPATAGATLTLSWDATKVTATNIALSVGSPFPTIVASSPWSIVTVLGPLSGAQPSGNFDAFTMTFQALPGATPGPANIVLNDDQGDFCWTDAVSSLCVPLTYSQANITVANAVPVPAAAWLVAPAVLAAGRFSRRRKAA